MGWKIATESNYPLWAVKNCRKLTINLSTNGFILLLPDWPYLITIKEMGLASQSPSSSLIIPDSHFVMKYAQFPQEPLNRLIPLARSRSSLPPRTQEGCWHQNYFLGFMTRYFSAFTRSQRVLVRVNGSPAARGELVKILISTSSVQFCQVFCSRDQFWSNLQVRLQRYWARTDIWLSSYTRRALLLANFSGKNIWSFEKFEFVFISDIPNKKLDLNFLLHILSICSCFEFSFFQECWNH